ncbi:MAG: hypothetical protein IKT40_12255 [Bacilli bacterium]|nr:hypothetical protein [Bacilli bacterium]
MEDSELKILIEKAVREEIQTLIEYSLNKKDFIFKVESLLTPLLSYWVLIRYNRLISNEEHIQRWKKGLTSWFFTLMRLRLRNNNNAKRRSKAIQKAYDNLDLMTDINSIHFIVLPKFYKENINTNNETFYKAIIDCMNDLNIIKEMIVNKNIDELTNYIENL